MNMTIKLTRRGRILVNGRNIGKPTDRDRLTWKCRNGTYMAYDWKGKKPTIIGLGDSKSELLKNIDISDII